MSETPKEVRQAPRRKRYVLKDVPKDGWIEFVGMQGRITQERLDRDPNLIGAIQQYERRKGVQILGKHIVLE